MANKLIRVGTGMCPKCEYPDPQGLYRQANNLPPWCLECLNNEDEAYPDIHRCDENCDGTPTSIYGDTYNAT